jgi:hypothetical protein
MLAAIAVNTGFSEAEIMALELETDVVWWNGALSTYFETTKPKAE